MSICTNIKSPTYEILQEDSQKCQSNIFIQILKRYVSEVSNNAGRNAKRLDKTLCSNIVRNAKTFSQNKHLSVTVFRNNVIRNSKLETNFSHVVVSLPCNVGGGAFGLPLTAAVTYISYCKPRLSKWNNAIRIFDGLYIVVGRKTNQCLGAYVIIILMLN